MKNTIEKWLDGLLDYDPKTKQQIKTENRKNKKLSDRGWFVWRNIDGNEHFGFQIKNLFTSLFSGEKKIMKKIDDEVTI